MENTLSLKSILMIVIVLLLLKPLLNCKKEGMSNSGICKNIDRDECEKFYCSLEMCKKYKDENYPDNLNAITMDRNLCLDNINDTAKKEDIENLIISQSKLNNLCKMEEMKKHIENINKIKQKVTDNNKRGKTEKKIKKPDPVANLLKNMK